LDEGFKMKLSALAVSIALAYSQLHAQTTTPSSWQTGEYYTSRALDSVKASSAYARGYTGKGSTIAILDTGISTTGAEFGNGKIVLSQDFSGSGNINDNVGHGTHVAGIAAASRNGVGMMGMAFDANLMIAKVTNSNMLTMDPVIAGLNWAAMNGAHVANLSANIGLSPASIGAKMIASGVYSTNFTNKGGAPANIGLNASQWAAAMKNDIVLVVAAGNDGTAYAGGITQMATAVDSKNNLVLGGRMLVVGSWDPYKNSLASFSNQAGSLCTVMVGTVCQDKYKISDFYILAPGTSITSTYPVGMAKSGYATMSGTSMSAPTIAGAVAIIHQEWPQMTGANIAKLLLVTANKKLPGYNVDVMGQGLLDMDRATQPVGALGIPVTGRGAVPVSTLLTTSGSASTAKIANIMALDDFQRDYYIPVKALTGTTTSEFNIKQLAVGYISHNNYSQYNSYNDYRASQFGDLSLALYSNDADTNSASPMIELTKNVNTKYGDLKFTVGSFVESGTWLGNSLSSENKSQTTYLGFGIDKQISESVNFYGNITNGVTITDDNNALITKLHPVLSYSWTMGLEKALNKNNSVGMMVYQPVTVYDARAEGNIPVGLDSNFNTVNATEVNFASSVQELRTGFYFKAKEKDNMNLLAFVENRQNYKGREGVSDLAVGLTYNIKF
jgi:hypothetical protein